MVKDTERGPQADFFRAIEMGDVKRLEQALEEGANVNQNNLDDMSGLSLALLCHWQLIFVLLQHGADINAQDAQGWTALHTAASRGMIKACEALVELNIDLNLQTKNDRRTALYIACMCGEEAIVRLLLHHGANARITNAKGVLPVEVATTDTIRGLFLAV